MKEVWIDADYIAVTPVAEEVGFGFDIFQAPVALSKTVWQNYVEWTDEDSARQEYQDQDARLWDVLFTAGGTLQLKCNAFLKSKRHDYSIRCIPRDGVARTTKTIHLCIVVKEMQANHWLLIEQAEAG